MRVIKKYNFEKDEKGYPDDCWIDLECEGCGEKQINKFATDHHSFWQEVIPHLKCKKCLKSTLDINKDKEVKE